MNLRYVLFAAVLVACGDDPPGVKAISARASKSGTIAIANDDSRVAMVNPEKGSVSIFDTTSESLLAEVMTGGEPSAVVIHPDNETAFVAVRDTSTVVRIDDLQTAPVLGKTVDVGSEPTGVALSPTGTTLYVAEWAEGRIAVIDTATMREKAAIDEPRNPRGLVVTNDGDDDDDDELLIVPEFYGEPTGVEATDTSRNGLIRIYATGDLTAQPSITLAPIDSGFAPASPPAPAGLPEVMTSPNQLWVAAVVGTKLYLPSISASPDRPTNFQTNVQPVVYVADLATAAEDRGALGSTNLARLVRDQITGAVPKFFLADLVDLDFVGTDVSYVLSRGADVVQRVVWSGASPTLGGTAFNQQIDINVTPAGSPGPCQNPIGIVTTLGGNRAYVNCWGTRLLGAVDLSTQSLVRTVTSTTIDASEREVQDGLHLFFTGRGRWSRDAWSSCASCHPDGLSDNITWSFAAGPRQSTSTDGAYSHGPGAQKRRVFNWTGIFDEMHDFERNTRGVQGGLGAVTEPNPAIAGAACGNLAQERAVTISDAGLGRSVTADQNVAGRCTKDFDKIETYEAQVRPPRALRKLDAASVERGRVLFGEPGAANNAGCVRCHGGQGWTASRVFFSLPSAPAGNAGADLAPNAGNAFSPPPAWPPATTSLGWNFHTTTLAAQPASSLFSPPEVAQNPAQVACVMRNVGTFGADTLETRFVNVTPPQFTARAQGRLGYNVPSLYGISVGAPYLHHGNSRDLTDLFDNPAWFAHATAGNPNWLAVGGADAIAARKLDLINFLLSIDADTPEQAIPTGFDGCP